MTEKILHAVLLLGTALVAIGLAIIVSQDVGMIPEGKCFLPSSSAHLCQ